MGFLSRLTKPRLTDLVTAIVTRDNGYWDISWIDSNPPSQPKVQSLDELMRTAEAAIALLYADSDLQATAELQYAIYPWVGKEPGTIILDVIGTPPSLVARDMQGSTIEVHGATADELVTAASSALPDPGAAMFRCVRKIGSL